MRASCVVVSHMVTDIQSVYFTVLRSEVIAACVLTVYGQSHDNVCPVEWIMW